MYSSSTGPKGKPADFSCSPSSSGLPGWSRRSARRPSWTQCAASALTRPRMRSSSRSVLQPVDQRLPAAQQRLVSDLDHRRAVVGLLGRQQPRVDQGVDQLPGRRYLRPGFRGARLRRSQAVSNDSSRACLRVGVSPSSPPIVTNWRKTWQQRGLGGRRQPGKDLVGPPRQGPFHAAQVAIGLQRQHVARPQPVKLIQRELQQRQAVAVCRRRVAEQIVQPLAGLQVLRFELQAGRQRRTPHELGNLRGVGRLHVVLPGIGLQVHQGGDLRAAVIEVAPQRGDDPRLAALGQG